MGTGLHAVRMMVVAVGWWVVREYLKLDRQCARCEMSFMNPQYELVHQSGYSLYRYRDRTAEYSDGGAPSRTLLYVPGNKASYKQVRSLGSELLGRTEVSVYSLDFGGELSAFDATTIKKQVLFARECLKMVASSGGETVLVGHSMGGLVARLAAEGASGVRVVELATPVSSPFPDVHRMLSVSRGSYELHSAANDVQAGDWDRHHRLDGLALSWSDPHHQAVVWSHSVVRHLADWILGGKKMNFDMFVRSGPVERARELSEDGGECGDYGPFRCAVTNLKMGRDFDVVGVDVDVEVMPGEYREAVVNETKTREHVYLTLARSTADFYIRRLCTERPVGQHEYYRQASAFAHMFNEPLAVVSGFVRRCAPVGYRKMVLKGVIYNIERAKDVIVKVKFDGLTIYPDTVFIAPSSGYCSVEVFDIHDSKAAPLISVDLSKSLASLLNADKTGFQKGLLLGSQKRIPFIVLMLIAISLMTTSIVPLLGFSLSSLLCYGLYHPRKYEVYNCQLDDLWMLKQLGWVCALVSLLLPTSIGLLSLVPCMLYALISPKKRVKTAQLLIMLAFEFIASAATVWNNNWRFYDGLSLYRLVPAGYIYALCMHVELFILLPWCVAHRVMTLPGMLVTALCANYAVDKVEKALH